MKRTLTMAITVLLVVAMLVGCGQTGPNVNPSNSATPSTSTNPSGSEKPSANDYWGPEPALEADPTPVAVDELPTTGIGTQISTDIKANSKYKIAIIVKNTTNPFFFFFLAGTQKAAEDMGFECISLSPARQDSLEDQVKIIEDAIQQGVDGIILHPIDSNGIMPAIRKAQEANIPVACIGTPAAQQTFLRSGVDYTATGVLITHAVAEQIGKKGKIIILEGPPAAQNAQERLQGIQTALKDYPEIEVVASQTTNFKRTEGMSVTENLLQKHRDIDAIIACNDESALGAIQALKAEGLDGKVVIGSFDGNEDGSAAIKNGQMHVSYNTDPFGSTYLSAVYIVQYLNDGTMPPKYFVPFPSELQNPLITSDNIDDYINNIAWWH